MPIEWLDDEPPKKSKIEWLDDDSVINQRVSQAHDAAATDPNLALGEDLYQRGSILPVTRNKLTGETGFGMPQILSTIVDAAKLPGEVYAGATQMRDADGNLNRDVINRSFDLAGAVGSTNFVRPIAKTISPAVKTAQSNIKQADEFGVDLSRGQATGRFADQAFEQDALTGGRGTGAQSVLEAQRAAQQGQIANAADEITNSLSPSRVNDAFQAGDNVANALQSRAQGLKQRSGALYDAAGNANAEIDPNAISGLSKGLREALDNAGAMEGTVVAQEYPTAARALNRVETLLNKAPEGEIVGVGWQNIERVRKMLLNKGSGPDEGRVLKEMRTKLDDWVETSVHDALVSGDPKFLDDLKEARGLYRQYKDIVDNSSSIIRKMADGSANSEQIANWLYGASKVGGRTDSSNTVREIKRLLGSEHSSIADLQRGVTMRLFSDRQGDIKTAGKLSGDIMEFVNNYGHELAKELYGPEALGKLRRFAMVLKQTVPDPKATNPSKSGHTITRQAWDGIIGLAPVLGLAANSFSGMLTGFGIKVAANSAARRSAVKAVSKPVPSQLSLPRPDGLTLQGARGTFLSQDRGQSRLASPIPNRLSY